MTPPAAAKIFFVTGTDTGVGKTRVATALLHALSAQGLRTAALKPVAAGVDALTSAGDVANSDALSLQQAANTGQDYPQVNPVLLHDAIAPHIAAHKAGRVISVAQLYEAALRAGRAADALVVEGAGGWLVPVNDQHTLADLAAELQAQVILVVGMRLGCLNHALLSAAAIRASGCTLVGWVANCIDPDMPQRQANIDALVQRLQAPLLAELEWAPAANATDIAGKLQLGPLLS